MSRHEATAGSLRGGRIAPANDRQPVPVTRVLLPAALWGAVGVSSAVGAAAGWQDMAPARPVAIVEFQIIDASARPDVAAMRALLARSGMSAEAWLAVALAERRRYEAASPERVAVALQNAGVTASSCTDVACLVLLGKALAVDRVVAGRVSKLSNLIWFLSATMVDVPAGRVRFHEEFELKGDIVDLLPKGMRALARRLATSDDTPMMADAPEPPVTGTPALQSARLTREQVLAALDRATERTPADFSGSDLSGIDLSGVDFKRANLSRCRLVRTNFTRATMFAVQLDDAVAQEADFTGTVLDVAWMRRIDLSRAILREASLYATLLMGANLTDADLTRARLIAAMSGAMLRRAKLVNANFGADPGNQPMGLMRTDATGADLTDADLSGANLRKVNLTRADLTGADLTGADLTGAELAGTILRAIRGRDTIRGLAQAKYLDQAVFQDR